MQKSCIYNALFLHIKICEDDINLSSLCFTVFFSELFFLNVTKLDNALIPEVFDVLGGNIDTLLGIGN